jgi:hypothetical protein
LQRSPFGTLVNKPEADNEWKAEDVDAAFGAGRFSYYCHPDRLSGYFFPSIFALTYASTMGFLAALFVKKLAGDDAWLRPLCVACFGWR